MSFLTAVLLGLSLFAADSPAMGGERVSGPGFEGVVIMEDMPGRWTPTRQQIAELETALPAYAAAELKRLKLTLSKSLSEYKRHYIGRVEGRRRTIHITFFHDKTDIVKSGKWLDGPIRVLGGGDNFLYAEYDTDAKMFFSFGVNSPR